MSQHAALPAISPQDHLQDFQTDIALALESILPTDQLLEFWDITAADLATFSKQPEFKQAVARQRKDMQKSGAIARAAAMKALSENAHRIGQRLSDPELTNGAFATLLNQAYQISGMKGEDARRRDGAGQSTGTINVQINLNGEKHNLKFDRVIEEAEVVE